MASSDVDQKYLGRIASHTREANPLVSKSLYQILGLSVILARKLFRARKLRKLDTSRDTKSLQLYHHIIWLSREGLSILEICVLPYTQNGELGPECQVIAAKLRASLYHIFCLFHNNPPISTAIAAKGSASATPTPLSPRLDTLNRRARSVSGASQRDSTSQRRNSKDKKPLLRDPIDSITSDASFLTNPYAGMQPGTTSPGITPRLPPGLVPTPPKPSAFLLPAIDFIPLTSAHFRAATITATACLPGAHPLRLSVAIEHAAFLWDCVHDHEGARTVSRRAIRALHEGEEDENVTDEAYDDAVEMVGQLGRTMRKKSWEGTPQTGADSTPSIGNPSPAPPKKVSPPPLPPVSAPPPTVPIPMTPRTVTSRRDTENPLAFGGGPVGGAPKLSPKSPASERRTSRGSSYHSHKPSGSGGRSTRERVAPRDQPATARRSDGDTPPSVPRKDPKSSQTMPRQTPPSSQRRRPAEMPPIPPAKDYTYITPPGLTPPRTAKGSASMRRPRDETTPTQRVTSQYTTPKNQPSRERRPSQSRGSGQKVTYPRPMDDSPPRASDLDLSGGPVQAVQPIHQSSIQPVTQTGAQIRQNGHQRNGHQIEHENGYQNGNGNGAPYEYIGNYGDGAQGGFYPSDEDRDRRRPISR